MKTFYIILLAPFILLISLKTCIAQWIPVYQDNNTEFYDAAFPTDLTGYVAAKDTGGSMVLCTTDGGQTWNKKYIPGWNFIDKIAMLDSMRGYIIKGGVPGRILRTIDGFNTWQWFFTDSSFIVQAISLTG